MQKRCKDKVAGEENSQAHEVVYQYISVSGDMHKDK